MNAVTQVDRAVETFLANLLIQIGASIMTDFAFRSDIVYDLNNPNSVILLIRDAMRELKMLGQKTANHRQNSEHVAMGIVRKPLVSFQTHTEILCRSAEQQVITYVPENGIHFIDDVELDPIRRVFALIGGQE